MITLQTLLIHLKVCRFLNKEPAGPYKDIITDFERTVNDISPSVTILPHDINVILLKNTELSYTIDPMTSIVLSKNERLNDITLHHTGNDEDTTKSIILYLLNTYLDTEFRHLVL